MSKYPGSLLPELQALETKMRDPCVHTSPYIQLMCFLAYHPLVPVKALQLLEELELPFPFAFSSRPTSRFFGGSSLFSGFAVKSVLWYKKLLYSCVTLEGTF